MTRSHWSEPSHASNRPRRRGGAPRRGDASLLPWCEAAFGGVRAGVGASNACGAAARVTQLGCAGPATSFFRPADCRLACRPPATSGIDSRYCRCLINGCSRPWRTERPACRGHVFIPLLAGLLAVGIGESACTCRRTTGRSCARPSLEQRAGPFGYTPPWPSGPSPPTTLSRSPVHAAGDVCDVQG
jgi:hypothetical protein